MQLQARAHTAEETQQLKISCSVPGPASPLGTWLSHSPRVALLQSGFAHGTARNKTGEKQRKGEWGRARRGECDNCWMRTECVRLATLPLGRPRRVHLSLSVSAAQGAACE